MTWVVPSAHELRAQELEAIHRLKWASQIRECGKPIPFNRRFLCGVRCCPTCSRRVATLKAARAATQIRAMGHPVLTQVKILCGWGALKSTLDTLRAVVTKIRRTRCFRGIAKAVGAFHVDLCANGKAWNVHVHLVIDAINLADLVAWEKQVRLSLIGSPAIFTLAPTALVDQPLRMARYLHKPKTFAPPPGALPLGSLDSLIGALHGQHLGMGWGIRTRRASSKQMPPPRIASPPGAASP